MAQLVEHILGKDEVISSTLISSSKNPVHKCERDFYLLLLTSSLLPQIKLFPFSFIDISFLLFYNIITLISEAITMGHSKKTSQSSQERKDMARCFGRIFVFTHRCGNVFSS